MNSWKNIFSIETKANNHKIISLFGLKVALNPLYLAEVFSFIFDRLTPKNQNKIVFNSEPDFCDNTFSLYEYMIKNHSDEFECIWISTYKIPEHFKQMKNIYELYSIKGLFQIFTSKYIISNHCNDFINMIHSNRHVWLNLWHGMPIKTIGYIEKNINEKILKRYKKLSKKSYQIATSDLFKTILVPCFKTDFDKCFVTGLPRNDNIFDTTNNYKIAKLFNLKQYKKVILYSPTYKERKRKNIREIEHEFNNIFYFDDYSQEKFIKYLEDNQILFIVKPHPLDEKFYLANVINRFNSDNIRILFNNDLSEKKLQIYELFQHTDIMISDISSIALDYLILNKPVIYLSNLDEEYNINRGFILEDNYKIFMPGAKASNFKDMLIAIEEAIKVDSWKNIRQRTLPLIHKYQDSKSSERIYKIMKGL